MNMQVLDWWIIAGGMLALFTVAYVSQRQTKSVADFLAANRMANRYLLTTANAMIIFDAATVIALFQQYYEAGFTALWWGNLQVPVSLFVMFSGWVVYRWRQTRILSQAQLFELRYSKRYRIFVGVVNFILSVSGTAVLPAIAANFLIYYLGFPAHFSLLGLDIGTFPAVTGVLVLIALAFTIFGGQITILFTNFFQGVFCNIVFLIIFAAILWAVDWKTLMEGVGYAPANASLINPFKTSQTYNYGPVFFALTAFFMVFIWPTHGNNQSTNASAKNAHEARMAVVLGGVRGIALFYVITLMPICAYMVMHHPDYASVAEGIQQSLNGETEQIQRQVITPAALVAILPQGIAGAFAVAMLMAFISTNDNYLLLLASMFVQDVIVPFRKKPFSRRAHMLLLRLSVIGVSISIYLIGVFYQQKEDIQMLWALLAIFVGGMVAVPMLAALYWSRGTTLACWASAFTGLLGGIAGFAVRYINEDFPLTGQQISVLAILLCAAVFVVVSLLQRKPPFDMDKLLHRGKYAIQEEQTEIHKVESNFLRILGIGPEFTRNDRIVYLSIMSWSVLWFIVFLLGSIYHSLFGIPDHFWEMYWQFNTWMTLILGTCITVWLTIGGIRDAVDLSRTLQRATRNDLDDGMVVDHHNLEEKI